MVRPPARLSKLVRPKGPSRQTLRLLHMYRIHLYIGSKYKYERNRTSFQALELSIPVHALIASTSTS